MYGREFPDQGIEPRPPLGGQKSQPLDHQGVPSVLFKAKERRAIQVSVGARLQAPGGDQHVQMLSSLHKVGSTVSPPVPCLITRLVAHSKDSIARKLLLLLSLFSSRPGPGW